MTPMARRALAAGAGALCVVLAFAALNLAMANAAARAAQDYLTTPLTDDARDQAFATTARAGLDRARALQPDSGAWLELEARWWLRAAQREDADREALLDRARDFANSAIARRPRWPYARLTLMEILQARGRFDAVWQQAVRDTVRLGARETRVQRALALAWLDADARATAVAPLLAQGYTAMLPRQPQAWIDAADRAGLAESVCARADLPREARTRCVDLGWLDAAAPQ